MKPSFFIFLFLVSGLTLLWGQVASPVARDYTLHIRKATAPINLDGLLDEPAWQAAEPATGFYQNFPYDTSYAVLQTEVKLTFDAVFLYVGAVVYEPQQDYITNSLKRDFMGGSSDVFVVNLDPFKDKLNGFHFAVSPFNVQREGIIDNGANVTLDWDNKWYSQVRNYEDRWVIEMAIPFKTLRYKLSAGNNTWYINFGRNSMKQNEISSWSPVPREFRPNNLAFSGVLVWEDQPPEPGLNLSVIPYIATRSERDFEFKLPSESHFDIGADAKIGLTPSLNLDLTFNPDFSQVEVDQQITNLSRFELFFPERRQFFLENEDLFSRFGFPDSRPFFSRRIGLANGIIRKTTTDGQLVEVARNVSVPIIAGMRLSGKLDQNWRIGLLNMQTAKVDDIGLDPANYSVGVLQRKIFERSTIGAVFVNKENFLQKEGGGYRLDGGNFNRVAGLEYNLYSKDNKWEGEFFYHRSFSPGDNEDAQIASAFLGYTTKQWNLFFANQYIGSDYRADAGFVPRSGVMTIYPMIKRSFFPKNPRIAKTILVWGIGLENQFIFSNPDFRLTDRSHMPNLFVVLPGQRQFTIGYSYDYTYLFFPFDPTNSGGEPLPEGSDYTYSAVGMNYQSDIRQRISYGFEVKWGEYFNGNIFQLEGSFSYRWQPYGIFAVSYAYNNIQLPKPYNSADFWLIGPRAELSFSRSLFFSTFLQYNTQANNVNINSRLQWRFKPVSDLFLVYTDNYFSDQFFQGPQVKNRALVLKMTYWLNI